MPGISCYLGGAVLLLSFAAAAEQQVVAGGSCPSGTSATKPRFCQPGFAAKQNQGTGCWSCEKETVETACPDGFPDDSAPNKWRCCGEGTHVSFDDESGTGDCCTAGHSYAYNTEIKKGACCPDGWTWSGSECVDPNAKPVCDTGMEWDEALKKCRHCHTHDPKCDTGYEPGPGGKCVPVHGGPCPAGQQPTKDGVHCEPIPSTPPRPDCPAGSTPGCVPVNGVVEPTCATCQSKTICPGPNDIGIEYGKCYVLHYSDGRQLGRARDAGGQYERDGFYKDLPFKVCDDKFDCSKQGPVGQKAPFTLQDMFGYQDWSDGRKGWISTGFGHERITDDTKRAAKLSGLQSCLDGKYGICMNGFEKGLASACPAERLAIQA